MNPSFRRRLVQLHRWLGLIVAPAIAYLAITGSTMLLRSHLEPVVDSRLHVVSACERPLPLAQLIANANERHAAGAIRQLELTRGAADATVVRYSDLRGVYVDPCSGAVLGEQPRWGGLFGTLEGLHRLRYFVDDGDVTEPITGTLSVVMGLMAVLGIALWWPRSRGHLKRSVSLRSSLRGAALQMHLHRVIGIYADAEFVFHRLEALVVVVAGGPAFEAFFVDADEGGVENVFEAGPQDRVGFGEVAAGGKKDCRSVGGVSKQEQEGRELLRRIRQQPEEEIVDLAELLPR